MAMAAGVRPKLTQERLAELYDADSQRKHFPIFKGSGTTVGAGYAAQPGLFVSTVARPPAAEALRNSKTEGDD